jgi:phospholipid transport system substrate-binding protein
VNALEVLNERRSEFEEDPTGLRQVIRDDLLPLIDMNYASRLVLGRAGRGATPEQVGAFADAMSEVLISRYADGLLAFNSTGQVEVLPLKGDNTDKLTRVRTRIRLANGTFAPVDFAFRKTEQGWKAFDITVEGISYVITYRNQLSPLVQEKGIDQVTADLLAGSIELGE